MCAEKLTDGQLNLLREKQK